MICHLVFGSRYEAPEIHVVITVQNHLLTERLARFCNIA